MTTYTSAPARSDSTDTIAMIVEYYSRSLEFSVWDGFTQGTSWFPYCASSVL